MRDGDAFAKKFGGESGNDPDFFKLTIKSSLNGQVGTDSVEFYLADYRFSDNSQDYIVDDWVLVELNGLGDADMLIFTLSSSDVGAFGINTPTYFCVDNVTTNLISESKEEAVSDPVFELWPNPASERIFVKMEDSFGATACISDTYGRTVSSTPLAFGKNELDVASLAKGTYTLQVTQAGGVASQIFIKK
jgi:hypothetical protein